MSERGRETELARFIHATDEVLCPCKSQKENIKFANQKIKKKIQCCNNLF